MPHPTLNSNLKDTAKSVNRVGDVEVAVNSTTDSLEDALGQNSIIHTRNASVLISSVTRDEPIVDRKELWSYYRT
jgi:hypothetical protein